MNHLDNSLPRLGRLVDERLAVVRTLAESLEASRLALVRNDAEAIARGAAHQAELCRQWGRLEEQLRAEAPRRRAAGSFSSSNIACSPEAEQSARLEAEWEALGARIRYLTRVHWSLLRHMQRSLAILKRVVDSCASTYTPDPGLFRPEVRPNSLPKNTLGAPQSPSVAKAEDKDGPLITGINGSAPQNQTQDGVFQQTFQARE